MSVQSPRTATDSAIGKLAASRLKVVKELSLDGWSELTDVGLKVRKKFNFLTQPLKVRNFGWLLGIMGYRIYSNKRPTSN